MALRILYDGWPLIYAPLSTAAWHLRTLLGLKAGDTQSLLALPTDPSSVLPGSDWETVFHHTHDHNWWVQKGLQDLANMQDANLIHTTSLAASLLGRVPTVISPAEASSNERNRIGEALGRGGLARAKILWNRIGEALGRGGLARAKILWPEDMLKPRLPGELKMLPPIVHPEFSNPPVNIGVQNVPDESLLVDGIPNETAAVQLLESWTWAAASIGELYPLVIIGIDEGMQKFLLARLPEFHVQESVRVIARVEPKDVPTFYSKSSAIVHLGTPAAWGNPLRNALAAGKAIVAQSENSVEKIVGSAAYLIKEDDLRAFGAAMITVVVDEKAREKLEDTARSRAAHWSAAKFQQELVKIYEGKG